MPLYEYITKCKCKRVVDAVSSVDDRNKPINTECPSCKRKVKAARILSRPLIKIHNGVFSDFSDKEVLEQTEI